MTGTVAEGQEAEGGSREGQRADGEEQRKVEGGEDQEEEEADLNLVDCSVAPALCQKVNPAIEECPAAYQKVNPAIEECPAALVLWQKVALERWK